MKTIIAILILFATGNVCYGQQSAIKNERSPFTWEKVDKSSLGVCKPITKEQLSKVESVSAIIFKDYEKINEYPDALEFVYADTEKFATLLLDFVSIEKLCCPAFTFSLSSFPIAKGYL